MEEKTRVETQKFREDVEKKINSFVQDEKTAKLEFPPMEKFQVCLFNRHSFRVRSREIFSFCMELMMCRSKFKILSVVNPILRELGLYVF